MINEHRHVLGSGWIRGRQTYRECVGCRQVFRWYGDNKRPELMRSDYNYYREMAEYHAIRSVDAGSSNSN